MPIDTEIHTRLTSDDVVTTLVGSRVRPYDEERNTALPCITYAVTSTTPTMTTDGICPPTRHEVSIQVDAYTKANADAVAAAVRGVLGSVVDDGLVLSSLWQGQEGEPVGGEEEGETFRLVQTYSVWLDE